MSNAEREFELRCPWPAIGCLALYSLGLCIWGIAVAFEVAPAYTVSSAAGRVGYLCLFEALAVLSGFMAIRLTPRGVQRRERLVFTDTAIVLTDGMSLWSRKPKSVPYADVTELRRTVFGRLKYITVVHAGGRFGLGAGMLLREEEFGDLLNELARRLEPFDVEIETPEFLWYRPQFFWRFMLVVAAVEAAALGLLKWEDPEFHLSDLVIVVGYPLCVLIWIWLAFFANWSARIFAIGFMLGMWLELYLVFLAVFGTNLQGPYSSTMICHQIFMTPGDLLLAESLGWLLLGGTTISGIVGGTALLLVWHAVKRVIRRRRDTANSS